MRSGFHIPIISSKVVTDHVFALESFSYINTNIRRLRFSHFVTQLIGNRTSCRTIQG